MLLAAAQHFAKNRNFDGTVYLIFQPAEEGGGGAREMIKDGLFEQFPMEAVFGMHNWPGMKAGQFAVSPGPMMASSNQFHIVVRGKGGHAALPQTGIDPVPTGRRTGPNGRGKAVDFNVGPSVFVDCPCTCALRPPGTGPHVRRLPAPATSQ